MPYDEYKKQLKNMSEGELRAHVWEQYYETRMLFEKMIHNRNKKKLIENTQVNNFILDEIHQLKQRVDEQALEIQILKEFTDDKLHM